jgi:hypothetical protein
MWKGRAEMRRVRQQRLLGLVIAGCIGLSAAPASASSIDRTTLVTKSGWSATVPQGACNYIYVPQGASRLVYYGTSGACQQRVAQHENTVKHVLEFLSYIKEFMDQPAAPQRPNLAAYFPLMLADLDARLPAKAADAEPLQDTGVSDQCIAVAQTRSGVLPLQVIAYGFPTKEKALAVETCVLTAVLGDCNRRGAGNRRADGVALTTAFNSCNR